VLNQDDIGNGTTYKQYSQTEKTKLAGIATGATANSADSVLINRANHTGTQMANTISDFNSAVALQITGKQDVLSTVNFGQFISGLSAKTTPVDADHTTISDSADSDKSKKLSLGNLKAYLKTYFDTVYGSVVNIFKSSLQNNNLTINNTASVWYHTSASNHTYTLPSHSSNLDMVVWIVKNGTGQLTINAGTWVAGDANIITTARVTYMLQATASGWTRILTNYP
jgi:hypothetical protein